MTIGDFAQKIVSICFEYHCSVTSWVRTVKRNTVVGGHSRSRHMTGYGIDLVPDNWDDAQAIVSKAHQLGLSALNEGDHIHIQTSGEVGRYGG